MGLPTWFLRGWRRPATQLQATHSFRPVCDELEPRYIPSVTSISLGTAGNFAVLGLQNTKINNSLVTVNGNEGVSQGGKLTNMAPSIINGNVDEFANGQYTGPGKLNGSISTNPTLMAQVDSDALNAASQAAALTPTQVFGTINTPTTIVGNGGLNVISINGDIKASLTLTGTASDIFIVNVTGTVKLVGSSALGLGGGVTAAQVLYNFVGAGGTISTHVGNVVNGTLLAPNYSFNLDGKFNGEIIGGGQSISLLSGTVVNQVAFVPPTSLSGFVSDESTHTGLSGVQVTLSGTDNLGNSVFLTTTTGTDGSFHFNNLTPGLYTITEMPPPGYVNDMSNNTVGTAGGMNGVNQFTSINLNTGINGMNYDFTDFFSGGSGGGGGGSGGGFGGGS